MPAPVRDGHVTQEYGVPGNYAAGYHTGRDWAGGNTRDILATRAGRVTRVAYGDGDYGNRVEILTGDIEHSYSHMASIAVVTGQDVAQGAYLGEMGETGNSYGIHCHYEERVSPYGYSDDRRPVFDTEAAEPEPEPIRRRREMITISSTSSGTIYLLGGNFGLAGIANTADLKEIQAALDDPRHTAEVSQSTYENLRNALG